MDDQHVTMIMEDTHVYVDDNWDQNMGEMEGMEDLSKDNREGDRIYGIGY